MGLQLSEKNIKKGFIESFPKDSGELAYFLWNDILELHYNWKNYRIFFGTNKDRVELLNRFAPNFFGSLHDILLHNIILSIGRLTDPASSGKEKDNASFPMLLQRTNKHLDKNRELDLQATLKELSLKTKKIRDLRNKLIAHSDLNIKLNKNETLPGVSRTEIENILQIIRDIFNSLEWTFGRGNTVFDEIIADDAEFLIDLLDEKELLTKKTKYDLG